MRRSTQKMVWKRLSMDTCLQAEPLAVGSDKNPLKRLGAGLVTGVLLMTLSWTSSLLAQNAAGTSPEQVTSPADVQEGLTPEADVPSPEAVDATEQEPGETLEPPRMRPSVMGDLEPGTKRRYGYFPIGLPCIMENRRYVCDDNNWAGYINVPIEWSWRPSERRLTYVTKLRIGAPSLEAGGIAALTTGVRVPLPIRSRIHEPLMATVQVGLATPEPDLGMSMGFGSVINFGGMTKTEPQGIEVGLPGVLSVEIASPLRPSLAGHRRFLLWDAYVVQSLTHGTFCGWSGGLGIHQGRAIRREGRFHTAGVTLRISDDPIENRRTARVELSLGLGKTRALK